MTGRWLAVLAGWLAMAGAESRAATVAGRVTIDGKRAADAVVYLERADGSAPPAAARAVMDQKNLAFSPRVLPVARGTTIEFTNSDDIQHNVFSPSAVADEFDLGTYGPGAARSVTLDEPGEVLVLCNIHMEMQAHILVLRDPYFAIAGTDGRYQIGAVPAGRYTAKVWQDGFLSATHQVEVPDQGELALDLALSR
jgi:plastocyanin